VCPDSDLDGIVDKIDECPEEYGQAATNGCPDTDGDGVGDQDDKCPTVPGTTSAGCPPIDEEDLIFLEGISNQITFETGSSRLTPSSKEILQQVKEIIDNYPGRILSIEGHTDNTGSAELNQELSEERAKACYNYLVELGISPKFLRYRGFGENNPVSDNLNAEGREKNRRVEFHFIGE
jgi:outer membrane protein OmpA-like peptidoglycan-associated protein